MEDQINIPNPDFDTLQLSILKKAVTKATAFGIPAPVMVNFNAFSV